MEGGFAEHMIFCIFHPFAIKEKQETKYKTLPFDCQKSSSRREGRAEAPCRKSQESLRLRVSEQEPVPRGILLS